MGMNTEEVLSEEENMSGKFTLIIYPPSVDLEPHKRKLGELLSNRIWIYGKELPEEFGAWNFLIVPKDKGHYSLRILVLFAKVDAFCCSIDILSLDNKIRMGAMKRFFENFIMPREAKPFKQRVEKIIEVDIERAKNDSVTYHNLSRLIQRIENAFDEIKKVDITDNKTFSMNLEDRYIVPLREFLNHQLFPPIRRQMKT